MDICLLCFTICVLFFPTALGEHLGYLFEIKTAHNKPPSWKKICIDWENAWAWKKDGYGPSFYFFIFLIFMSGRLKHHTRSNAVCQ